MLRPRPGFKLTQLNPPWAKARANAPRPLAAVTMTVSNPSAIRMKHFPLLLTVLLLSAAAQAQSDVPQLMRDRGCVACHRADPRPPDGPAGMPLAPAWNDIAARYKSVKGAQQQLTATVMTGSTPDGSGRTPYPNHWSGKVSGAYMPTHRHAISEAEAARIVAWVLAIEPVTK